MDDLFADLTWRGVIHQVTDPQHLPRWLATGSRTLYAGIDPTADSLHVGHLMAVMLLRRFQHHGHRPIALVGGATGMIGDPSGKSQERNLLDVDTLRANIAGMEGQLRRLLDFESSTAPAVLVNNYDWMSRFGVLDFLREVGKHAPVSVMLAKESVKDRLERGEEGISFTEFSYMLLQAYDFAYLHERYGCELQVGGSDQWGNITAGIDLARRLRGAKLYGLTCPLLTRSDGAKMGKTEQGAVWLSPARTSPYQFYQYWINVDDADAGTCLRYLTELDQEEIESLDRSRADEPQLRNSQRRLADELTRMIHGDAGLSAALRATEVFFGAEIEHLGDRELAEIFADVPSTSLPRGRLENGGLSLVEALVESGLAKGKGDARRTIEQGGAYVNNRRFGDVEARLTANDLAGETILVLRKGRKNYALLKFTE